MTNFIISTFYKFFDFAQNVATKPSLLAFCQKHQLKGTIITAHEGINATIAGLRDDVDALYQYLEENLNISDLTYKESKSEFLPFLKMKIRLKKEIVTLGVTELSSKDPVGTYIDSKDWDSFIAREDVVVIDTRNKYETELGSFVGAVDPNTRTFKQFASWAQENLECYSQKKIAMYCTGGIRCEKSTSYLKKLGANEVFHLKGGILQYLADTGNINNKWQGSCFVFDERVNLDDNLEALCHTSSKEQMFAK